MADIIYTTTLQQKLTGGRWWYPRAWRVWFGAW